MTAVPPSPIAPLEDQEAWPSHSGESRAKRAARIARIGYWDADFDGNILAHDGEYLAIHGFAPDAVITRQEQLNCLIHPDDKERVEHYFQQADQTEQDYQVDYRIIQPGGKLVYLREVGEVVRDTAGNRIGHSGTTHDITQASLAEKRLRTALAQSEENLQAKNRFLSNMSHELRTPLNAIKGYEEMLSVGLHPERSADYLAMIVNASDHLTSIISDILTISEVEQNDHVLSLENIPPQRVIQQAIELSGVELDETGPPVTIDCSNAPEDLTTDPRLLVQILVNLLSNARKYAPNSKEIIVRCCHREDRVAFEIQDFGPGIPEEELDNIAEPFVRGTSARQSAVSGTGLGLSLTRDLARRLDGSLVLKSPEGAGLTARVVLSKVL
ncbi:PAS domain-containing sensor histidine kinase [Rhodovibrionaceae bacterium A322]